MITCLDNLKSSFKMDISAEHKYSKIIEKIYIQMLIKH